MQHFGRAIVKYILAAKADLFPLKIAKRRRKRMHGVACYPLGGSLAALAKARRGWLFTKASYSFTLTNCPIRGSGHRDI